MQYSGAQNLIPNPGFDDLFSNKNSIYPWTKINTIDFFLESQKFSIKKNNNVDKNFILRKARSSPAYIGIRIQKKYREFIQIKLEQPLIAGHHYRFELYMVPSEHCHYFVRSLGVSFYDKKHAYASNNMVKKFQPQILFYNRKGLKSENGSYWKLYTADFCATGNEKYITIGNFSKKQSKRLISKKFRLLYFKTKEAYIYIDDISLKDLDAKVKKVITEKKLTKPDTTHIVVIPPKNIEIKKEVVKEKFIEEEVIVENTQILPIVNYIEETLTESKKIVLRNIHFDYNSAKLRTDSYTELNLLLDYMKNNPKVQIEISGHTDNIGSDAYNKKLSNLRAKAVFDYLITNKIDESRLTYAGKGFDEPVADNNTAEGRNLNRRVEINIK